VNNIQVGVKDKVFKFADDMRLVGVANSSGLHSNVQLDKEDLKSGPIIGRCLSTMKMEAYAAGVW